MFVNIVRSEFALHAALGLAELCTLGDRYVPHSVQLDESETRDGLHGPGMAMATAHLRLS